jgi:DNA-binding GntR family transcriptional regulator
MPDRPRPRPASPPSTAADLPAPTVANQLAAELSRRIVEGHYAPGASLREVPLAGEFGVSRSSVREALRILERDGVARIEPHRGASVTRLSTDELIEIYQVRTALLGLAMALACERCTDDDVTWLRRRFAAMRTAGKRDDERAGALHATISAEMALHLMRLAGNRRLEQLLTQMAAQIARYTRVGLSTPERRAQSVHTWQQVVEAMAQRDAASAERLGRKLVTDTLRFALGRIAGLDPGALG